MIIRFAVIGLGNIGYRHGALIAAHPEAELVGGCDVRLLTQRSTSPDWLAQGLPVFDKLDDLLATVDFDVACICTPNGLHAIQARSCLDAGRHVVVEKPMALRLADCNQLIDRARQLDLRLFGVMQNRYSPAAAWLKRMVREGSLGRVLQVHLDCFWNRDSNYYDNHLGDGPHPWHGSDELDGGVLFTQFAHFIDLLCWIFGEEVEILAAHLERQRHNLSYTFADTGMVHFRLPGGAIGSLNFSTVIWDRNFESTCTVIGECGTVKLGGQYMNEVRYCHVRDLIAPALPPSAPPNDYGPYKGSAANHHFVIDNVVDVLNGRAEVATTAEEGRAVVRVINEIHAAALVGIK